jgi:hypothetical protein
MESCILSMGGIDRTFVVVEAVQPWVTPNIAFYQSSATSNVTSIARQINPGTFFPIFGMREETEAVPKSDLDRKGHIKKMKLTSMESDDIYEWMYTLIINYFNHKYKIVFHRAEDNNYWRSWNAEYTRFDTEQLTILRSLLLEIKIIHYLLCNYFLHSWQLCFSILLSKSGYWIQNPEFADFVMSNLCPEYRLPEQLPPITIDNDDELIQWLKTHHAQSSTDITLQQIIGHDLIKMARLEYLKILGSVTLIDQQLSILEKIEQRRIEKEQRKKPKTAGTRKKRKSRKRRH